MQSSLMFKEILFRIKEILPQYLIMKNYIVD